MCLACVCAKDLVVVAGVIIYGALSNVMPKPVIDKMVLIFVLNATSIHVTNNSKERPEKDGWSETIE
ncbi:MAG: hypothetical protein APF81_19445 [Desulfosporosinus sp. BRH_c37]|nr:MAG: hypothetical protein APF81_19445 [Desulfosporosinus sp. BRH_c37]